MCLLTFRHCACGCGRGFDCKPASCTQGSYISKEKKNNELINK